MSFFNKLFLSSRSKPEQQSTSSSNVRVLIYRECDRRGRKLLFDSDAVEKVPLPCQALESLKRRGSNPFMEITPSYGYKYKKPNGDVTTFGEMIFGCVALSFKESAMYKIHPLDNPHRLMFSTVVPNVGRCRSKRERRPSHTSDSSINKSSKCTVGSDSLNSVKSESSDESSKIRSLRCCSQFNSFEEFSSSCCDDIVLSAMKLKDGETDLFSCSKLSVSKSESSSNLSFIGSFNSQSDGSGCSWSSSRQLSQCAASPSASADGFKRTSTKIGLAVVIDLLSEDNLESILLYNSRQIEAILGRLRYELELAYARSDEFVSRMVAASFAFQTQLAAIVTNVIFQPEWFSLVNNVTTTNKRMIYKTETSSMLEHIRSGFGEAKPKPPSNDFVNKFSEVLRNFDTKETNFFISTLITAVLTHNLDWVSTVCNRGKKESAILNNNYDAKTIIATANRHPNLAAHLITILTYFFRPVPLMENIYSVDIDYLTDPEKLSHPKEDFSYINSFMEIGCEPQSDLSGSIDTPDCVLIASPPVVPKCTYQSLLKSSTSTNLKNLDGKFVSRLFDEESSRKCCNSLTDICSGKSKNSLYPNLEKMAALEGVNYKELEESVAPSKDFTLFVRDVLTDGTDEGYQTFNSSSTVRFLVGDDDEPKVITTKSSKIDLEPVTKISKKLNRSKSLNIPISMGAQLLRQRCQTLDKSYKQCLSNKLTDHVEEEKPTNVQEIKMPKFSAVIARQGVPSSSLIGCVSSSIQPQYSIQCVTQTAAYLGNILNENFNFNRSISPIYILADMEQWSVSLLKNQRVMFSQQKSVRLASSQLVADMLESFNHLFMSGLSPIQCISHLERRLHEIYTRSVALAEFLLSTDCCSIDDVTSLLNVAVNDVPLLMAVAATHSPSLLHKYGISFS